MESNAASRLEIQLLTKTRRGPSPLTLYAADTPTGSTGVYSTLGFIALQRSGTKSRAHPRRSVSCRPRPARRRRPVGRRRPARTDGRARRGAPLRRLVTAAAGSTWPSSPRGMPIPSRNSTDSSSVPPPPRRMVGEIASRSTCVNPAVSSNAPISSGSLSANMPGPPACPPSAGSVTCCAHRVADNRDPFVGLESLPTDKGDPTARRSARQGSGPRRRGRRRTSDRTD